ncbi:hypothetical protein KI387_008468, partial [Taxus chinensis]
ISIQGGIAHNCLILRYSYKYLTMAAADKSTPLGRLHDLEKCIVKSLECVGNIIEEFSKTSNHTEDIVNKNGREFEHLTQ